MHADTVQPLTEKWSIDFAHSWLNAWNEHDVDSVLSHYADDVILISAVINKMLGHQEGISLKKIDLEKYCDQVFNNFPELKFKIEAVAVGYQCITIHYSSPGFHLHVEVINFNLSWKINKSISFY